MRIRYFAGRQGYLVDTLGPVVMVAIAVRGLFLVTFADGTDPDRGKARVLDVIKVLTDADAGVRDVNLGIEWARTCSKCPHTRFGRPGYTWWCRHLRGERSGR